MIGMTKFHPYCGPREKLTRDLLVRHHLKWCMDKKQLTLCTSKNKLQK